jgi:hypothetical protein
MGLLGGYDVVWQISATRGRCGEGREDRELKIEIPRALVPCPCGPQETCTCSGFSFMFFFLFAVSASDFWAPPLLQLLSSFFRTATARAASASTIPTKDPQPEPAVRNEHERRRPAAATWTLSTSIAVSLIPTLFALLSTYPRN